VIADNGDYFETRLLSSGPRTNPWFQESASRVIHANELVALDTDVVGCHGYFSDLSRTFHVGPGAPTVTQKRLYRTAYEQVHYNLDILYPGMGFNEYSEQAWAIPVHYYANRYYLSAHGCGMTGEYPYIVHREDMADKGYDGVMVPGMTLCVESYIGHERGGEGVKLEEQLYIRADGQVELLSDYPFDPRLMLA
jgi:Xaa-Pro aminopeptidase